jgi:site-specific recombinase XerD
MDCCKGGSAGTRNRALIAVLYRTGVKISEAVHLKLDDLDLTPTRETIRVTHGRLLVDRTLALDAFTVAEIERWLAIRRSFPGTLLFCSAEGETRGGPMTVPGFRGSLEMLAGKAGLLGVRVHPEAFRYTLAAELMVEQWPLPYIMTQLGIGTLQAFDNLLKHLGVSPPPDVEVMEIMRARPPMTVEREP